MVDACDIAKFSHRHHAVDSSREFIVADRLCARHNTPHIYRTTRRMSPGAPTTFSARPGLWAARQSFPGSSQAYKLQTCLLSDDRCRGQSSINPSRIRIVDSIRELEIIAAVILAHITSSSFKRSSLAPALSKGYPPPRSFSSVLSRQSRQMAS